jgi:hypothetical protein
VHLVAAGCGRLRPEGIVHLDPNDPAPEIGVALAWRRGARESLPEGLLDPAFS